MSEDEQAAPTLGQRLDALARRRAAAHQPRLAWVPPLAAVLRRAERLGDVTGDRFERTDTLPPPSAAPPSGIPAHELGRIAPDSGLPGPGASPHPQAPPSPGAPGSQVAPAGPPGIHAPPAGPPVIHAPPARPPDIHIPSAGPDPAPPGIHVPSVGPPVIRPPPAGPPDIHAPPAGPAPEDEPPQPVPPDLRYRLRRAAGPAADLMRVHVGPASDARARAAEADAVTVGADVHVRRDRYAPRRLEGLALLAHEATHVTALVDPGRAWRRTVGDDHEEEALARRHERDLLGRAVTSDHPYPGADTPSLLNPQAAAVPMRSAGHGTASPAPAPPAAAAPAAIPAAGPAIRRAATNRDTAAPAPPDLESLRRDLVSEVMRQLKTEFERGG